MDRGGWQDDSLRLTSVNGAVVVSAGDGTPTASALAEALLFEAGRVAVVVDDSVVRVTGEVVAEVASALESTGLRGFTSVRLIAPGAGAPAESGPAPAQELADRLGVEVIAPDGQVVAVPDGSLFVLATEGWREHGAWWQFLPDGPPLALAARFPTPHWERYLRDFPISTFDGLVLDEVPAGLWLRSPGAVEATDLAFAVSVDVEMMALLVSRPGDEPLRSKQLRQLLEELPDPLRARLVITPYGDRPLAQPIGRLSALAVGDTVRVRTGLFVHLDALGSEMVALRSDGAPGWRPFAHEMAWHPGQELPVLVSWTDPDPTLPGCGRGMQKLGNAWVCEVVEAGLWIRPANRIEGARSIRGLGVDAERCTVVVGVASAVQDGLPWPALAALLRRLPRDARQRLRLAVPEAAGSALRRACSRELDGTPVEVLTDSGGLSAGEYQGLSGRP